MHPFLKDRRALALYVGGWLVLGFLLALVISLSGIIERGRAFSIVLPLCPLYAFMCLSSWYLCRMFPLQETPIAGVLGLHAVSAAITSALWLWIGSGWVFLLGRISGSLTTGEQYAAGVPVLFSVGAVLYLLVVAIHYALIAFNASRESDRRALELKVLAREAELKALRSQIDPHFLFNSLNSISAFITGHPAQARAMLLKLSDFLRLSLLAGSQERISLSDELALVRSFLSIEEARFGSRLRVDIRCDTASEPLLVPPLLLQPLIENAVTHGIAHILEGGMITVRADRRGSRLDICIQNPCDANRPRGTGQGLGLENVRQRLAMLHGSEARLDTRELDGTFAVALSLPAVE